MNYLAEIKAFYDRLELNPQPNTAIALWHALMSIANKAGWPDTFTVAQSVLGLRSGLNASAIKRARNKLATDGFIEWKSRGGNQAAQYRIISLVVQNKGINEPQYAPQSEPQVEPQCEPQSEPINKTKTKTKTDISISACVEEFLSVYPKKGNRHLTEINFVDCLMSRQVTETQLVDAAKNYADRCKREETPQAFMKSPENFLKDLAYCQYLPGVYEPPKPIKKGYNANKGLERADYGDLSELEKELLAN